MYVPDVKRDIVPLVAVVAVVAATMTGRATCAPTDAPTESGLLANPFAVTSPWRQLIPSDPSLDADSDAMIAGVESERALNANLVAYGVPIYLTTSDSPARTVTCTEQWGICPFAGWAVSIPEDAEPNSGSDHAMVTVDGASGNIFEFWRAAKDGENWSTGWGAVNSVSGSGWGGVSTGSGASRLAGVIRISEIASGNIPHALALQTENACPTFRPPALKSDGTSTREDCLPEGARLQLDPALDLSQLKLTPGELAVATAMQRYGGYVMDVGGAPLSVSFELDTSAPGEVGATYKKAGFRWDYDAMEHIPWEKLRVLS